MKTVCFCSELPTEKIFIEKTLTLIDINSVWLVNVFLNQKFENKKRHRVPGFGFRNFFYF